MTDGPPTQHGPAILNTEPGRFSPRARAALRSVGRVDEIEADRPYLLDNVAKYDVLFIALRNLIDSTILDRAKRLKVIVTPTTGTNHIDVGALSSRGIALLSLEGETAFLNNITATAELTWGLLLSLARKIPAAKESVLGGRWARDHFCGMELRGKTLGVVGYGRLGKIVAQYGEAFRMVVVAFDRTLGSRSTGVQFLRLDDLLRLADVVSIHLPLSQETRGLFDDGRFQAMKPGAVLINTSRGDIIDEQAMLSALDRGDLAAAAVDVLTDETSLDPAWLANNRLVRYARTHDNLLITPHIGGVTYDSTEQTNLFMIARLEDYLKNGIGGHA
jgi:D-3-phosphoglycerate dehydrogenase / 2-oxoglutarate reductase